MGVALAAASYVRVPGLLIPIVFLLLRWMSTREIWRTTLAILVVFVVMALLIVPWSIRNTLVHGQFILLSTSGGKNMWDGNNPYDSTGLGSQPLPPLPGEEGMNPAQRSQYYKEAGIAYIKERPFLFIARTLYKAFLIHDRETSGVIYNKKALVARYGPEIIPILKIINQIYWLSALGLALVGLIVLGKRQGWINMITHPTVMIWAYL